MNKAYSRINWENHPSDETPLNESNLNKVDAATDEIDNRVITLDTTKATKTEVATLVADVTFEKKTGIITITKKNGSKITIDTQMEKIAVNFSYDSTTQRIILTLIDGTKQYIDLSALITQYEFLDSDTVAFSINSAGKVSAIVKEGSIQEKHLQPNYLADIKVEVAKAQASQTAAAKSESNAKASETAAKASESNAAASATKAQSYAVGGTSSRTGEDTDNAKYYSQQAADSKTVAANSANAASTKADEAKASQTAARESETNAAASANTASQKAANASNSAAAAESSANEASKSEANAEASANTAQRYATADKGSAKYYYEQARSISESFSGALRPMGTVTFANLPTVATAGGGDMYNISDQFTTTADFKEGAGNIIPAGANVYKTADGKWDVLAGTPVTGVKGNAESSYRTGNVNITPANIGAATSNHTHNYAGSSSVGGSANSALALARSQSQNTSSSYAGYWYKLGEFNITQAYADATYHGSFHEIGNASINPPFAEIFARAKQQGELGKIPQLSLTILNSNLIKPEQIRLICTSHTESSSIVELWIQDVWGYSSYVHVDFSTYNFTKNTAPFPLQATPPDGTYITATVRGSYLPLVSGIQTQVSDLTANIQQYDVIAEVIAGDNVDSGSIAKDITVYHDNYRAYIIVFSDTIGPSIINTYTILPCMIDYYQELDLYDPNIKTLAGWVEFNQDQIHVHVTADHTVIIYGLISL